VQFSSTARFGAKDKGWQGDADITDVAEMTNSALVKYLVGQ
jgi:hypothetical protein